MVQRGTKTMVLEKAQLPGTWKQGPYGNGKQCDGDESGGINEGQIVSMEADLDKGTLRFWVDDKQHGPGYTSGVEGRVRWAVSMHHKGAAVQIVSTPELQAWSASWVWSERDEELGSWVRSAVGIFAWASSKHIYR
jgi:hypothetical protein